MTYNIWDGGGERISLIEEVIAGANPDVLLLNEADDEAVVADLASRLSLRHVWARGSGDKHIALLTSHPIVEWRVYNRPPFTQAILSATLSLPAADQPSTGSERQPAHSAPGSEVHRGQPLTSTEMQPDRPSTGSESRWNRASTGSERQPVHSATGSESHWNRASTGSERQPVHSSPGSKRDQEQPSTGTEVQFFGVHLLPYFMLLPYEFARWRTVRALLGLCAREAKGPHLLFGDFNAASTGERADTRVFSKAMHARLRLQANLQPRFALRQILRAGYTDCFRKLHPDEPGQTWMPWAPSARLDYIFADARMAQRLRACDVVTAAPAARASDHFPLVAEFA